MGYLMTPPALVCGFFCELCRVNIIVNNIKIFLISVMCFVVATKLTACFNPETVDGNKVKSFILATLATITIGEICAYRLIQQDVKVGELNQFTTDFVIISISLLEVLVGPFIAWFGYNNRRVVFLVWNIGLAAVTLLWLALPSYAHVAESEYCHGNNLIINSGSITPRSTERLTLIILSAIVFCLTRVAVWSHGIAYIEEHAPAGSSLHFGVLVAFRVIALIIFNKIISSGKSMNMQVFAIAGSTIGNVLQVCWFIPKYLTPPEEDPQNPWSNRGFFASTGRVFRNTLALSQMAGIGLLAAALWGYAYYENEIIKVKFHIDTVHGESLAISLKQILRYVVVVMAVLYVGIKFSAPNLPLFCRMKGIQQAALMTLIGIVFYILLIFLGNCNKGYVAGLEKNHYSSPECSRACGCVPRWREFSPVCVVDDITTYLSPCHAGCSTSEGLDNIIVYSNCTCAPDLGRAAIGACSQENCSQAYELHHSLFIMAVMATVLAFQAQGMVLLRALDPRDRSLALGVAGSVVSSITFCCGHLIFLGISAASCRWFEGGRCHLYNHSFPTYVGSASASMAFLSLTISLATWGALELAQRRRDKDEDLAIPEERILMQERPLSG